MSQGKELVEMSERQQILNDLRNLIDWLETHPNVDLPYDFHNGFLIASPTTKDEMIALAKEFGECEKQYDDDSFRLIKRFGLTKLYGYTDRQQVCERIVVGVEEIPERVEPARTREIVEWKCEPLLEVS